MDEFKPINIIMDNELQHTHDAQLVVSNLASMLGEATVIDCGTLLICRSGEAEIVIDFQSYTLKINAVLMLFPGDVVNLSSSTDDFAVEMLRYDRATLREASMQLEQTVYSFLRDDRCLAGQQIVFDIFNAMFALLRVYFRQDECRCKQSLVLCQLKSFFLGYYDWINRNPQTASETANRRSRTLFTRFMELLERDYKTEQTVAHYAAQLNISAKYLNTIVHDVAHCTPKAIIDHYVVMQMKTALRTTDVNIKELAYNFNFSDASFMCRYFRHHTGRTPQQFRRENKAT